MFKFLSILISAAALSACGAETKPASTDDNAARGEAANASNDTPSTAPEAGPEDELTEEDYEAMAAPAEEKFRQQKGAYVEYDGVRHALTPYASCGDNGSGGYNTWAATMMIEEPSVVDPDKPRVHVFGAPDWSAIEFYLGGTDIEYMVRHEGADRVPFDDGYYAYNGETNTSPPKSIKIRISCG